MQRLRVQGFSISVDGYGAGPNQSLENPLGVGVTGGIQAARDQAFAAAGGRDVRLAGGVATIRQYLQARLVDELHLAMAPVLLGSEQHLLAGLDLPALGYACTEYAASDKATHVVITKRA